MRASHDDPVVAARGRLGNQVLGGHVQLDQRLGRKVDNDLALRQQCGELVTDLEGGADDRKVVRRRCHRAWLPGSLFCLPDPR